MSQDNGKGNGGRILAAAARIAGGAATGGFAGAAIETAQSFLPEIIKGAAIILALVVLLPLLVFVGVPHIMFGYDGAAYGDVVDLTVRAGYMDGVYKRLDAYGLECAEAFAENAKGGGDYDEVSVEPDITRTNARWLIAISSVAYRQDLYAMDEASIKGLYSQKLTFSAEVTSREETRENGEGGEDTVTIRSLEVRVQDLEPEAFMDKLGFTDEEKEWARFLHETLERESPLHPGAYRVPPAALSDEFFAAMIKEAEKYLGYPYVYGGSSPSTSFDCSGFVCWVINRSGFANVGRTTAQGLYNLCTPIDGADARPGDLVFFHNTYQHYEHITHVGIFIEPGVILHAGNPIGYASYTGALGGNLCAFGRINREGGVH